MLPCFLLLAQTPTYELSRDISYTTLQDRYARERCRLDLYVPKGTKGFATVIWLHGGGLTGGQKEIPSGLLEQGLAVVAPAYRLTPKVKGEACIQDAAAAVAWVVKNLPKYGADPRKIFVSGHSAGGYLASMVVLDKRWLKPYGIDPNRFAGLAPFSGQAITHFAIRKERGISDTQPVIDRFAPLFHVRKDAPPILLLTGDREKELLGRYEEVAYLWRMLKEVGHPSVQLAELKGADHGGMPKPGMPLLLRFVRERCAAMDARG